MREIDIESEREIERERERDSFRFYVVMSGLRIPQPFSTVMS